MFFVLFCKRDFHWSTTCKTLPSLATCPLTTPRWSRYCWLTQLTVLKVDVQSKWVGMKVWMTFSRTKLLRPNKRLGQGLWVIMASHGNYLLWSEEGILKFNWWLCHLYRIYLLPLSIISYIHTVFKYDDQNYFFYCTWKTGVSINLNISNILQLTLNYIHAKIASRLYDHDQVFCFGIWFYASCFKCTPSWNWLVSCFSI